MSTQRIAVFPGSFDPVTIGHTDIVYRSLNLFDKIIVGIGVNSSKKYYFTLEQREQWLNEIFKDEPKVEVMTYQGLTVDFCKAQSANYILRGLRNVNDFEYEKNIGMMNHKLESGIETVLMLSQPEHSAINSAIVRDIIGHGGDATQFLPKEVSF